MSESEYWHLKIEGYAQHGLQMKKIREALKLVGFEVVAWNCHEEDEGDE